LRPAPVAGEYLGPEASLNSLKAGSFPKDCDRVLPRPFVRWLCLLPDMKAPQFVNLEHVFARFLKVVELKLMAERTRACLVTTADANYDLRSYGHNIDIVDRL